MLKWLEYASLLLRNCFVSRCNLALENLAFRSQLAIFEHQVTLGKRPKPKPTPAFRQLWMILSKAFVGWRSVLVVVKPETVVHWHKQGFKLFWRHKSRHKNGRPVVSTEMRRLIRKINAENPLWSPERIHDQLAELGFSPPSPNTIRKYLPKPTRDTNASLQTWKTFIKNHMDATWAADFFVVPTLTFRLIYVFIIVSHERREISHFGVTQHPTAEWTTQQLREATPFGEQSKYLIHDNDSIFRSEEVQRFLDLTDVESVRTGYKRPDQNGICERFIGILRRELLDHIIPMNERHLRKLLKEYVDSYYHPVRTHKNLGHLPPHPREIAVKSLSLSETSLQPQPILGGLYHSYGTKAA